MVFGLFTSCDAAEIALTNFSEIGLGMRDVSAISKEQNDIDALGTHGSLTGVMGNHIQTGIEGLLDEKQLKKLLEFLEDGGIVLAVSDDKVPQEVIEETLKDYHAEVVTAVEVA